MVNPVTTQATTTGYISNYEPNEKNKKAYSKSEVVVKQPAEVIPADEFRIYDDKAIHGWLDK